MARRTKGRARACVAALVLTQGLGGMALAEPLRLSLDALADPGPASTATSGAQAARFVAAGPGAAAPAADASEAAAAARSDGEREFVPSLALPRREAGGEFALPRPDESKGQLRLLGGDGATTVPPSVPEQRPLGDFGRRDAGHEPAAGGRAAAEARVGESGESGSGAEDRLAPQPGTAAAEDAFDAPRDASEAAAAAAPPATMDGARGEPSHERMIVVFIVVPLVLAAMLMLWRLDRGGSHRRRRSEGRRGARVRSR